MLPFFFRYSSVTPDISGLTTYLNGLYVSMADQWLITGRMQFWWKSTFWKSAWFSYCVISPPLFYGLDSTGNIFLIGTGFSLTNSFLDFYLFNNIFLTFIFFVYFIVLPEFEQVYNQNIVSFIISVIRHFKIFILLWEEYYGF